MGFLIILKWPPALGHFKIIPTMLSNYAVRRSALQNKCIAPALPAACVRRNPSGCWVVTLHQNLMGLHSILHKVLLPLLSSVACPGVICKMQVLIFS